MTLATDLNLHVAVHSPTASRARALRSWWDVSVHASIRSLSRRDFAQTIDEHPEFSLPLLILATKRAVEQFGVIALTGRRRNEVIDLRYSEVDIEGGCLAPTAMRFSATLVEREYLGRRREDEQSAEDNVSPGWQDSMHSEAQKTRSTRARTIASSL